jgi:ComF family protein
MTAADLLRSVGDALIAVTIAPLCAACKAVLEHPLQGPVCANCWLAIPTLRPPLCRTCGGMLPSWRTISLHMERCPACRRRPGFIDAGRASGTYEGALREIVHAFKYEGRRTIGARLGLLLRTAGRELLCDARCAIPVPLHPWRRVHRGFNQAADLAHALDLPIVHALWRSRATSPQTGLTASARRRNVRGAFRVSPLLRRRVLDSYVAGHVVILVDDVWTTGATLNECARVLKEAGAREVRALTVARAADPAGLKTRRYDNRIGHSPIGRRGGS